MFQGLLQWQPGSLHNSHCRVQEIGGTAILGVNGGAVYRISAKWKETAELRSPLSEVHRDHVSQSVNLPIRWFGRIVLM